MIRTPTSIQLLMDGITIQYHANDTMVPTYPMKLGFVTRPNIDPTNPNQMDSTLWIYCVSYDSNYTNYANINTTAFTSNCF